MGSNERKVENMNLQEIKRAVALVLESAEIEYDEMILEKVIEKSHQRKMRLREVLMKHPNYNEEMDRVSIETSVAIEPNFGIASNVLAELVTGAMRINVDYWWSDGFGDTRRMCNYIYTDTLIPEQVARLERIGVKAREGQKLTRVVQKWLKPHYELLSEEEKTLFNRRYANFCDCMKKTTKKEIVHYSLNPYDFITMSHGNSWSSCHSVKNDGCHKAGTLSLMGDNNSLVAYIDGEGGKKCRVLLYMHEYSIMSCRLYGGVDYNAYFEAIHNTFLEVVKACGVTVDNDNWDDYHVYKHAKYNMAYGDFEYSDDLKISTINNFDYDYNNGRIKNYIGGIATCLDCGGIIDDADLLSCCTGQKYVCECCGDRIPEGEVIWIDGVAYCECCTKRCNDCGEWYLKSDLEWVLGQWVCNTCLDNNYINCGYCDDVVHIDNSRYDDESGEYYCDYCFDNCIEHKEHDEPLED